MSIKSFLLGVVTGAVLTFGGLFIYGLANQESLASKSIKYLEKPVSYENKTETSFKVLQVLGNAALANEISSETLNLYTGNTVLIKGENYYSDQVITVKNPKRIGTYSYTNNAGMPMTVPVIDGEISE